MGHGCSAPPALRGCVLRVLAAEVPRIFLRELRRLPERLSHPRTRLLKLDVLNLKQALTIRQPHVQAATVPSDHSMDRCGGRHCSPGSRRQEAEADEAEEGPVSRPRGRTEGLQAVGSWRQVWHFESLGPLGLRPTNSRNRSADYRKNSLRASR